MSVFSARFILFPQTMPELRGCVGWGQERCSFAEWALAVSRYRPRPRGFTPFTWGAFTRPICFFNCQSSWKFVCLENCLFFFNWKKRAETLPLLHRGNRKQWLKPRPPGAGVTGRENVLSRLLRGKQSRTTRGPGAPRGTSCSLGLQRPPSRSFRLSQQHTCV